MMEVQETGPQVLAKAQLSAINRALASINELHRECDSAEKCGIDVQAFRDAAEEIRQQLNQFKAVYFPSAK